MLVLLLINIKWARPGYNWDLLAYVAVAYEFGGVDPAATHARSYETVRQAVPAAAYALLTESTEYRAALVQQPDAFQQQLPGYRMKVAYPALMMVLQRAGVQPVETSLWISRAAYIGIGIVVFLWLGSFLPPAIALVTAYAISSISPVLHLAELATPDALSTLVLLVGSWLVFQRNRVRTGLAALVLSTFVRPDNLVFVIAVCVGVAMLQTQHRKFALVSTASAAIIAVSLTRLTGGASWSTLFEHAFVQKVLYQQGHQSTLSWADYIRVYLRESHPANLPPFLMLFGVLGGWLLWLRHRCFGRDAMTDVILVCAGYVALHWLVYPDDDRFFVVAYLSILIALVRTSWELYGERKSRLREAPVYLP